MLPQPFREITPITALTPTVLISVQKCTKSHRDLHLNQELLSSNDGKYGFQTPMGTNHLFQGWADVFLTTPKQGIRDTYFSFGGKVMNIQLLGEYHWLDSDEDFRTGPGTTGDSYGKELDVSAAYTYNKNWLGKLEYANYQTDDCYVTKGACTNANGKNISYRDTEKFWLTVIYNVYVLKSLKLIRVRLS